MAGRWDWIAERPGVRVGVVASRREQTTSTVVVVGEQALLIDPAWDPDELAWIAADLTASGITVTGGFATHAHHDHVLWHPALGTAPRWASRQVGQVAADRRPALVAALGPDWPAELAVGVGSLEPIDQRALPWPADPTGPLDNILVTHNGHAPGHTALWLPTARVLIAGDMLSDVELPLLEESTAADYLDGLTELGPYVDKALVIIPGHGTPTTSRAAGTARWAADRRYLDALFRGARPADDRLARPGMAAAHRENRVRAGREST